MATDAQLIEWSKVTAPVVPGAVQEWSVIVNSAALPLVADQKKAVRRVVEGLGAENVELLQFSNTRIGLPQTRARRETLPVDFIPTAAGTPVWWRVRFVWRDSATATNWPAEKVGFGLPAPMMTDPTGADILLDSVGGNLEDAPEPEPDFLDRAREGLGDLGEGLSDVGEEFARASGTVLTVAAIGGAIAGGLWLLSKVERRKT